MKKSDILFIVVTLVWVAIVVFTGYNFIHLPN